MNMTMHARYLPAIFWTCFLLTGYVYFIYPVLLTRLARFIGRHYIRNEIIPPVSIIISAYNEEHTIAEKIENTLSLDYPRELVEIIVGSDGSTDRTNEIVRSYADRGVRLLAFPENRGKTMVQNDCVSQASHEIVVFMDAASMCEKCSLKKLVANFADSRVGAVAGRVVFTRENRNLTTESQGVYWKYEQILKQAESSLGSLVGVDGPLYAIRKSLYTPLDQDMMSDFISPLLVIGSGSSVVYEPEAVTYEEATTSTTDEFNTRRRIVTRGFTGISRHPKLLNPAGNPLLAWQILSHKILRWLVGFYYVGMLISSLFLMGRRFYLLAFSGLAAVLGISIYGMKSRSSPGGRWYAIPYYFILVNLAAMFGVIDYLRGKRVISWKPVRQARKA